MTATIRALSLLLASVGGATAADEPKTDVDKFQGTWAFVTWEQNGMPLRPADLKMLQMVVDRDRYELKRNDEINEAGTIKVDSTKSPKQIELKITKGDDAGKTQLGVYELDGDTLKFCVSIPPGSKERPSAFETKEGSNTLLLVLKRKKD